MSKLKELLDIIHERNPQTVLEVTGYIVELMHKERKRKVSDIPRLSDVISFFVINGYTSEAAMKAYEYYKAGDWHDSKGKPILNWKLKMRSVWFKDENKPAKPKEKPKISDFFTYEEYKTECQKQGYEP